MLRTLEEVKKAGEDLILTLMSGFGADPSEPTLCMSVKSAPSVIIMATWIQAVALLFDIIVAEVQQ